MEAAEAGVILETTPLTEAAMNGTMTTDPLETALAVAMEDLTEVPEAVEDFVEVQEEEEVVPEEAAAEAGVVTAIVEVEWAWKLHGPVVNKIFQLPYFLYHPVVCAEHI